MKKFFTLCAVAMAAFAAKADVIKVESADKVDQVWDSQFWIVSNVEFKAGDAIELKMKIKADKEGNASEVQIHKAPGDYLHWESAGKATFTTEWTDYSGGYASCPANGEGGYSLAINLNELAEANTYYFDNIILKVNGENALKCCAYKYNNGEIQEIEVTPGEEPEEPEEPEGFKNGSAKIDYSAQWATVKLTTKLPFTFDDYVAYKVVLDEIVGEPDANGVYFNILCESVETHKQEVSWSDQPIDESDCIFYDNVKETAGTFEGELKERMAEKGCTAGIRTFALQYTNNQTMSVVVKEVYLQTPDGEWVRQEINGQVDAWTNTVVTFIEDVNALNKVAAEATATAAYNLNGQKTNAAKGLQIRNGKIIMIK